MALSQGVKDTVDAMNNVDKALLALYTAGHDDTDKAIDLGKAMVTEYWPYMNIDALTYELLALAILKATNDYWVRIYRKYKAAEAEVVRLQKIAEADEYMEPENPLDDLNEPTNV